MKTSTVNANEPVFARPKYYEMDGALQANANRAWLLAFLTIPIALLAIGFAVFVRLQPPTIIRIAANGDVSVVGKPAKGAVKDIATGGTDEFLDEAFVRRFLTSYLNYSPTDVDDHWAASLNMMTRNLRGITLKAMSSDNTRGKIDDGQIQSVFHLREIDPIPDEPLTYLAYGVKDVHHLSNGTETTDHFVNEYRIRLIADRRSNVNPDGLWIAEYSERPIDGERRDQILNAPDATLNTSGAENKGGCDGSLVRQDHGTAAPNRAETRPPVSSTIRRSGSLFSRQRRHVHRKARTRRRGRERGRGPDPGFSIAKRCHLHRSHLQSGGGDTRRISHDSEAPPT